MGNIYRGFSMKYFVTFILALAIPAIAFSLDLSNSSLAGKWQFKRIVTEEYETSVNIQMEFKPDGTVINYAPNGQEISRGSYKIEGGYIIYTDKNGEQPWEVKTIAEDRLHVDHRGAEMFFER